MHSIDLMYMYLLIGYPDHQLSEDSLFAQNDGAKRKSTQDKTQTYRAPTV